MNKWMKRSGVAAMSAVLAVGMFMLAPSLGEDSEHQDLTLTKLEAKLLNDNIAIQRAELALEMEQDELAEAEDNKNEFISSDLERDKRRRSYYIKQAEMNVYVAEKNLADTMESELLGGKQMYYEYLLLVKEIANQNTTLLRLQDELEAVNKKIELGTATTNNRTSKELEISKAEYALTQLQDEKEAMFLDFNLSLQQDLSTVLVIEDIEVPFEAMPEIDLDSDLEYVLATNKELYKLEKQDELDTLLLDIYEDDNSNDQYDSAINGMKATLKQNILDIADKKLNLEYTLRSNYNSLLNAYDTIVIKELELENANISLNTTTKRYEVGFETENTLKAAQEAVAAAELALLQTKLDYYLAIETYYNFIE